MEPIPRASTASPARFRPPLLSGAGPLRELAIRYIHNILVSTGLARFTDSDGDLMVESRALVRELVARRQGRHTEDLDFSDSLRRYLSSSLGQAEPVQVQGGPLETNLRAIGAAFRLEESELAILQLMGAHFLVPGLTPITDIFGRLTVGAAAELVAAATALTVPQVEAALARSARLVTTRLISVESSPATLDEKLVLDPRLLELLSLSTLDVAGVRGRFIPGAPAPLLDVQAFEAVAEEVAMGRRLLAVASERNVPGINILLHGPTGCGKTELACLLAREAGVALYLAGAAGAGGFTPSAPERLASLHRAQHLLVGTRSAILFDDLDDLFDTSGSRARGRAVTRMSKAWFSDLLERNEVPTVWVTSDATVYDPGILRRFSLSIALEHPAESRRIELLGASERAVLSTDKRRELAGRYPVSAGVLTGALRVAGLVAEQGDGARVVTGLLNTAARLTTGFAPARAALGPNDYRLGFVNASMDLLALASRLAVLGQDAGATLCLHGPPGTGKSEFVRHLAERLGRPLVARRVSDIESKWVGEGEKNLAEAFLEAERERAVLLFDEADSFLRDRRGTQHRWEVTLTNEFLQRLEETRGIVACTTNLIDTLDQAVLRRFALKIAFDYLSPEQAEAMFMELVGRAVPQPPNLASRLANCGRLALGDFGVVRRRARLLGRPITADWLLEELSQEAEARGITGTVVGFRPLGPSLAKVEGGR